MVDQQVITKAGMLKIESPDSDVDVRYFHKSKQYEEEGNHHVWTSIETPMREDAFLRSDKQKIQEIEFHFRHIMEILGLDLTDDSLAGTPYRVAKMYVSEVFSGLNPKNKPDVKLFENKYGYQEMLVEKDITFYSHCEHHFVPIIGKAHIAYKPNGKVVGLSKLNRIVQYFAKRPQVQERMTLQIAEALKSALQNDDVAVCIDATHLCVSSRGVQDITSSTTTSSFHGIFQQERFRQEFLTYLGQKS